MHVTLTYYFRRQFKKLERSLKEEAFEKIELFKLDQAHVQLKAHKLSGRLRDRYSFSVNYKIRIIYTYVSETEVALLTIGDHDVYK